MLIPLTLMPSTIFFVCAKVVFTFSKREAEWISPTILFFNKNFDSRSFRTVCKRLLVEHMKNPQIHFGLGISSLLYFLFSQLNRFLLFRRNHIKYDIQYDRSDTSRHNPVTR